MYIITGLGNPGQKYKSTRHNVGFMALDKIAKKLSVKVSKVKFKGLFGSTNYKGEKVLLLKPHTYMNRSGEGVKDIISFYKIPPENLIVIYDDMDLPLGKIRVRPKGSSAGHNGIKSIIYQLSSENFARVRIGIGKPPENFETANYVLGKFNDTEKEIIEKAIDAAADAALVIVEKGIQDAMNRFNSFGA